MKILESQSAVLTNYEVLTHLNSLRCRYEIQDAETLQHHNELDARRQFEAEAQGETHQPQEQQRAPPNLETILKELTDYLSAPTSPLAAPCLYTDNSIRDLITKLAKFDLTKAELLMIFNLRPKDAAALDPIIEEAESRFGEGGLEEMVGVIGEVLGGEGEADVEMEDGGVDGVDGVNGRGG